MREAQRGPQPPGNPKIHRRVSGEIFFKFWHFLLILSDTYKRLTKPGKPAILMRNGIGCDSSGRLLPANLVNSNEVRAVRRGGNVNDGANDGPCYFNANNAPANANWNYGAALYPYPAPGMAANATTHAGTVTQYEDEVFVHILFRSWKQLKCSLLERLSKPLKGRKGKKA
jgi:hypothetical protein